MKNTASYIGKKFGRLTVITVEPNRHPDYHEYVLCQCACGNVRSVQLSSLLCGKTTSCGCYAKERSSKVNTKHGYTAKRPRIYRIWENMRSRCNYAGNTNYVNYGGRGIKVCDAWDDFATFLAWATDNGYEDSLSIDRIDVNGNYCPENCRWATRKEQDRNKTTSHLLTFGGKTQCLMDWCKELNLTPGCLNKRLKLGWSVEQALLTPVKKGANNG